MVGAGGRTRVQRSATDVRDTAPAAGRLWSADESRALVEADRVGHRPIHSVAFQCRHATPSSASSCPTSSHSDSCWQLMAESESDVLLGTMAASGSDVLMSRTEQCSLRSIARPGWRPSTQPLATPCPTEFPAAVDWLPHSADATLSPQTAPACQVVYHLQPGARLALPQDDERRRTAAVGSAAEHSSWLPRRLGLSVDGSTDIIFSPKTHADCARGTSLVDVSRNRRRAPGAHIVRGRA